MSKSNQEGFSLPELLVAIALLSLLLAAVFGILTASVKSYQNAADQSVNIQLSRDALSRISEEIRNATSVQDPTFTSGADHSGSVLNYTSPVNASPNRRITIGTGADANNVVILNRDNGAVLQKIGQGRVKAASLGFVRSAGDQRVFTVNLVFQSNAFGGSIDTPVKTVVTMLNSGP